MANADLDGGANLALKLLVVGSVSALCPKIGDMSDQLAVIARLAH